MHTDEWMEEVNRHANENAIKMLVGNKADAECVVTAEEAEDKAKKFGIPYVETSAKSAYQVDLAFMTMARELMKRRQEIGSPPVARPSQKLNLTSEPKPSIGSCCK